MNPENLQVEARSNREIVMTRMLNAPRKLVFEAFTKPELVQRWLLGPDGWSMPVCEIDLRVGGKYRYVWRNNQNGQEMSVVGVFREVVVPERVVHSERFEQPWYEGECVVSLTLTEHAGKTTAMQSLLFDSNKTRDAVLKSGMERGVAASYNRLAEILALERLQNAQASS